MEEMKNSSVAENEHEQHTVDLAPEEMNRREALAALGKAALIFGATPAMTTLLTSKKVSAASCCGEPPVEPPPPLI
jgi:hypothetical protein